VDTNRQQSSHSELLIDYHHSILLVKGIHVFEETHVYITVVLFGSNPPYLSLSNSSLLPRCNPVLRSVASKNAYWEFARGQNLFNSRKVIFYFAEVVNCTLPEFNKLCLWVSSMSLCGSLPGSLNCFNSCWVIFKLVRSPVIGSASLFITLFLLGS
jgi:hypothetical protein